MADSLSSNVTNKLMEAFIPAFESKRKLSMAISTNAQNLVNGFDESTGDAKGAVRIKRPLQFVPQRTADGDFTSGDTNPVIVGTAPAEVGNYATVFIEMTDVERALESKNVAESMLQLVEPAAEDICNEIESELGDRMMKAAAFASGNPQTPIADWLDIASAGTKLDAFGLPAGRKYCALSTFDGLPLANEQKGLAVNPEAGSALAKASIANNYAGFDSVFTTDNMPSFTSGTATTGITVLAAPTQTYNAVKDSYEQVITLTGGGIGNTLTAGTTLVISSVNMVHFRNRKAVKGSAGAFIPLTVSLLEDITFDGSNNATATVSGCGVFETGVNGAYNTIDQLIEAGDAVTIQEAASTTYGPGLAFHEGFFAMGSIKLKTLDATDSSFTTKDGLNFRISRFANGVANKHQIRIDFRPTFACLNPFFGEKVYGVA